jgi:hypothetical protein
LIARWTSRKSASPADNNSDLRTVFGFEDVMGPDPNWQDIMRFDAEVLALRLGAID